MKHVMMHKIISGTLLVYFALFVIPPVSSFTDVSGAFAPPVVGTALDQDHRQARLYLVDIIIWLKLKQSRHSDVATITPDDHAAAQYRSELAADFAALQPVQTEHLARFSRSLHHAISGHLSRTSDIYFARSGIAPPFLS